MGERLLTLRIRPPRIAVLIDKSSTPDDFVLATRFLSQLWGGRYCPIIPVDGKQPDALTAFRLKQSMPEFVVGLNLEDKEWAEWLRECCQPRQYVPLTIQFAGNVRSDDRLNLIHSDRAIVAMFEARTRPSVFTRKLKTFTVPSDSAWAPYCAALFGVHPTKINEKYRDEDLAPSISNATTFVDAHRAFVDGNAVSWLDAGSYGLSIQSRSPFLEPTIVLVNDTVQDLSLLWNLRLPTEVDEPAWIIPIPFEQAKDSALLMSLKQWLQSFLTEGHRPNYCIVTSASVPQSEAEPFLASLRTALEDTNIRFVDYEPARNRLPEVIPFEYTVNWPVNLRGRSLKFLPPGPKAWVSASSESWFVDLLNDNSTARAVGELDLPKVTMVSELLNGPSPPTFEFTRIRRYGLGIDSINVRTNSTHETITFHLPSSSEVLEEILREHNFDIVHDEKRSSYVPTIKRFGSLHQCAAALSGDRGKILNWLRKGTCLLDQIKAGCKLGKGEISDPHLMDNIDKMLRHESDRIKRIGRKRFEEYGRGQAPVTKTVGALLEYWAERQIVKRSWEIGPCLACGQKAFVDAINLQKRSLCPNCGHRLSVNEKTRVGYGLTLPVFKALGEGMAPVALTGRFLRNLSGRGFIWIPGLKYRRGDIHGDIDIVACCDGHVIFGECKCLSNALPESDTWNEVIAQFLELASVAIECKASLVVLAAQVDTFPARVEQEIESKIAGRIPVLLLTNNDLEKGHRNRNDDEHSNWIRMHDLIPKQFPEPRGDNVPGVRQINLRWGGIFTKGR